MNSDNMLKLLLNYYELERIDLGDKVIPERKITPAELFRICSKHINIDDALNEIISSV